MALEPLLIEPLLDEVDEVHEGKGTVPDASHVASAASRTGSCAWIIFWSATSSSNGIVPSGLSFWRLCGLSRSVSAASSWSNARFWSLHW